MNWRQRTALLLAVLSLTACASPAPVAERRGSSPPRARCLTDPAEGATRPLFFLFCIETP